MRAVLAAILVAVLITVPAGALAAPATGASPAPTTASTTAPTTAPRERFSVPTYQAALSGGDFRLIGNSVVRCPLEGEDRHGGGTAADCHQATHFTIDDPRDPPNSDGYHLKNADVDGDGSTVNSSTARVTVPAESVITYAQLSWGGHTGVFSGKDKPYCTDPDAGDGSPARKLFESTPDSQRVSLALNGGAPAHLDPANVTRSVDPGSDTEMYTGWLDVTGRLAELPVGVPASVTVGNVWALSGFGCTAGWTLTIVYSTFGRSGMRTIDVYTDPFRKAEHSGERITVRGLNVRPNQAGVELGVTGYQGDRDYGDRFVVAGEPVANPCVTGEREDFFTSCADGALDPATGDAMPNNLSAEAKIVAPRQAVAVDGNTIEVRLPASDDAYLLHGLVLSEVVRPALEVRVVADPPVALPGEQVTFTTTVTNTSTDTMLPDVLLEYPTPGFDGCDKPVGWLQPGQSVSWTCGTVAGDRGLTLQARASSRYGTTNIAVANAEAAFGVVGLELRQTIQPGTSATGAPVTLSSTVTNTADAPARQIRVTHPNLPDCATPVIDELGAGASTSVSCTTPAPAASFTGAGGATWVAGPAEREFTVGANPVTLDVITATATVRQTVSPDRVRPGDQATFTTVLHNTGDDDLTGITAEFALCPQETVERLAPDETVIWECAYEAGDEDAANAVTVKATNAAGQPFSVSDPGATLTVVRPVLSVTQAFSASTVPAGQPVTITYTVANGGDEPLTDATVHTEQFPSCAPPPTPALAAGATATATCEVTPTETVETTPEVTATDALGGEVTARGEPATITVVEPELTVEVAPEPATVRKGGSTVLTYTVTNTGEEITGLTLTDDGAPGCVFEPLGDLAPGESTTDTCEVTPTATFTSTPSASGTDADGRPVTATGDPVEVQLIDPKLEITVVADPTEVEPGDEVRFTVVVRNVGDVRLHVEITNETARGCGFRVPASRESDEDGGLVPGAAQSQKCTVAAPDEEGPFTSEATYSALPAGVVDQGEPITGAAEATVAVVDDPSNGPGGTNPPATGGDDDGYTGGGDSVSGGGGGSGGPGGSGGSGGSGGLPDTGFSVLGPLAAGLCLLLLGGLMLLVAREGRRRRT